MRHKFTVRRLSRWNLERKPRCQHVTGLRLEAAAQSTWMVLPICARGQCREETRSPWCKERHWGPGCRADARTWQAGRAVWRGAHAARGRSRADTELCSDTWNATELACRADPSQLHTDRADPTLKLGPTEEALKGLLLRTWAKLTLE